MHNINLNFLWFLKAIEEVKVNCNYKALQMKGIIAAVITSSCRRFTAKENGEMLLSLPLTLTSD